MPIHFSLQDYIRFTAHRAQGLLGLHDTKMANDATIGEQKLVTREKAEMYRVRDYNNADGLRKAIDRVIQSGQMSAQDAPWFSAGSDTMNLLNYVVNHGSKVALIFDRGMKEERGFVAGSIPFPSTKLKRIEIHDAAGSYHVVWERWNLFW